MRVLQRNIVVGFALWWASLAHAADPATEQTVPEAAAIPPTSREMLEFLASFEDISDEQFAMFSTYAKQDAARSELEASQSAPIQTDIED